MAAAEIPWAEQHPWLAGLAMGGLGAVVVAFARGAWPAFVPAWPLVLLALLGFRRTMIFQALVAVPAVVLMAFHCRIPVLALMLPVVGSLLAANLLVRGESARRWSVEHAAFAGVAVLAHGVTGALCEPVWGMAARLGQALALLVVLGGGAGAVVLVADWMTRRPGR